MMVNRGDIQGWNVVLTILATATLTSCGTSTERRAAGDERMRCFSSPNGGKPLGTTRKSKLAAAPREDDGTEIAMMIVYTTGAKKQFDAAGKNVATAISNAVSQINAALAFSKINLHVTPVYAGQTDYQNATNLNDDLDWIRDGEAGKGIRDLQDANAADVVAVIREKGPDRDGTSLCGRGISVPCPRIRSPSRSCSRSIWPRHLWMVASLFLWALFQSQRSLLPR
jgi:hypothetical protein